MSSSGATVAPPPLQTPLTQEFPMLATLGRHDLEGLLAGWTPVRAESAWYRSSAGAESANAPEGSVVPVDRAANTIPTEEEAFENFIESLPEIKQLRQESQRLLRQSEEKAARNAALEPALERMRNETQQLYDRARALEQQWPIVERDMNEASKRFAPNNLLFSLTQSASKLHDQSESLASAFVEGLPLEVASTSAAAAASAHSRTNGLTPPDSGAATPTGRNEAADGDATFVRRYRALRTTYHRRNLIADRWARGAVTWRDD